MSSDTISTSPRRIVFRPRSDLDDEFARIEFQAANECGVRGALSAPAREQREPETPIEPALKLMMNAQTMQERLEEIEDERDLQVVLGRKDDPETSFSSLDELKRELEL